MSLASVLTKYLGLGECLENYSPGLYAEVLTNMLPFLIRAGKTRLFYKKRFLGFNLQMLDIKLRLTSTMKRSKSSEQRFGHVNATNHSSFLLLLFYPFLLKPSYTINDKPKNL